MTQKEKINVAELLKYCPKGMELDCTIYDDITLFGVDDLENTIFPITVLRKDGGTIELTKYGQYTNTDFAKCVIFPKGKTTWEGFHKPFEDGDIVVCTNKSCTFTAIFKSMRDDSSFYRHGVMYDNKFRCLVNDWSDFNDSCRLATEEEKEKLFDAIKANGYKWNEETKSLVEDKGNISDGYHTFNELYEYRLLYNASMFNELAKQGLYDVHKSKRHSDGEECFGGGWFIVQAQLPTGQISNHYEMKDWDLFQIPEKEKANPYDGHTPQDVAKRLRDFLAPKTDI